MRDKFISRKVISMSSPVVGPLRRPTPPGSPGNRGFHTSPSGLKQKEKTVISPPLAIIESMGQKVTVTKSLIEKYSGDYKYKAATESRERAREYGAVFTYMVAKERPWGKVEAEKLLARLDCDEQDYRGQTFNNMIRFRGQIEDLLFETFLKEYKKSNGTELYEFKASALNRELGTLVLNWVCKRNNISDEQVRDSIFNPEKYLDF